MSGRPKEHRVRLQILVTKPCKRDLEALAKTHGSLGKGVESLLVSKLAPQPASARKAVRA